jgi:hypothetical protein
MALAAWQRGFDVEVFVNDEGALFVDSVRSPDKKAVITLVQEDFLDQLHACRCRCTTVQRVWTSCRRRLPPAASRSY